MATGDLLCVNGRTEDGNAKYTAASSSGTAVTSAWTLAQSTGTANTNCGNALLVASVTSGGTLTVTVTLTTGGSGANPRNGATLIVATGAAATATAVSTSARQLSYLTTGANSAVFTFTTDWSAAASSGATFVPASNQVIDVRATDGVDQQATAGTNSSVFAAHWTDTGSVATTTYGLSSPSAGTYNTILAEFTAAAGGGPPWVPVTRSNRAALVRAYNY